jgi:hypothetical protein
MKTFQLQVKDIPDSVIDPIVPRIASHFVALLHRGDFAGSATLVRCRDVFGLLTAHHVVKQNRFDFRAGSGDKLGFAIDQTSPAFYIPMEYLEPIEFGVPVTDRKGPDMTFVKIPVGEHLALLRAKKSFWNLEYKRQERLSECYKKTGLWCFSYQVAEKIDRDEGYEGPVTLHLHSSTGWGTTVKKSYERDGLDYYRLPVNCNDDEKGLPESYGGASGGGLWKIPLQGRQDGDVKAGNPVLAGVIFYQTRMKNRRRTIYCHGPKSIYERVYERLSGLL